MATVNLTSNNYDSQLADILRRQKYAELLAQQGNEDIKVESVNGVPTPISPFQGLAKVFQSGMGAYLAGQSSKDKATLDKTTSERLSDALANYGRPNTGANVGTVDTSGIEGAGQSFPITGMVTGPATQNDKMQRASAMMGMGDIGKAIGGELLKQSVEPEKLYTLNRGDTLQTGTGQVRGVGAPSAPANKTPFAAVVNGKPGMFVYDDAGNPVAVPGMTPFRTGEGGEKPPPGFRYDAKRNLVAIPGGPGDLRTTQQGFTQENNLRDEYQKGAKSFSVVNDAYSKISSVPASPTGDLSMLYNYMKMLDPNSVVRESEFRVAATARPLLENLGLSWDRIGSVWSGNRMTPGQRADFKKSAEGVYGAALNNQNQWDTQYTDLANSYGLDPKHIVTGSARYKNKQDPIASARAAIAAGADKAAVIKRLQDAGINTEGL